MRIHILNLAFVCCICGLAAGQSSPPQPSPPPTQQAAQGASTQRAKGAPVAPVDEQTARRDRIRRESEELAALTKSIPAEVSAANRGMLPKDILERLNRIEKLSKQLRKDLAAH
jgi:hypothetical protein